MALTITKSMEISDFPRCWEHVKALVEEEMAAVAGHKGMYEFSLELIWDSWEDEDDTNTHRS